MSDIDNAIFRNCPTETDHPFTMVPTDLLRNPEISAECKWFISYLLSHTGKWRVSIPYVIRTQKISKNRIYPIIKEAIEAGYVLRTDYLSEGKKRYVYEVARTPKFKKSLLCPQNQDTEKQDTENEDTKEYQPSSLREEDKNIKEKKTTRSARQAAAAPIKLNSQKRCFEGIGQDDIKAWRDAYPSINLEKELKQCVEWAMSVPRLNYRKSILSWLKNVQEKNTTSFDKSVAEREKEVSPSDVEKNRKFAADLEKASQSNKIDFSYQVEAREQELRFNRPGNEGAVDVSYQNSHKTFLSNCRKHLIKLKLINDPIINVYFKSFDDIE